MARPRDEAHYGSQRAVPFSEFKPESCPRGLRGRSLQPCFHEHGTFPGALYMWALHETIHHLLGHHNSFSKVPPYNEGDGRSNHSQFRGYLGSWGGGPDFKPNFLMQSAPFTLPYTAWLCGDPLNGHLWGLLVLRIKEGKGHSQLALPGLNHVNQDVRGILCHPGLSA